MRKNDIDEASHNTKLEKESKKNKFKFVKGFGVFFLLLTAVGVISFLLTKQQDIRQRAAPPSDPARIKGQISILTSGDNVSIGDTFQAYIIVSAPENFKSAQGTVTVSSNLQISSVGQPSDYFAPCNFDNIVVAPSTQDLSFSEGYSQGSSASSCTVYQANIRALSAGTATIAVTGGSIIALDDSDIFESGKTQNISVGGSGLNGTIEASPALGTFAVGDTFQVDFVVKGNPTPFNAVQADISLSPNLSVASINTTPVNSCNLQFLSGHDPTITNLSFVGSIISGSSAECSAFAVTLRVDGSGLGLIGITNGSIKSFSDNSENFGGVINGSYNLNPAPTPTLTPTVAPSATPTSAPAPTNTPAPFPTFTPAPSGVVCVGIRNKAGDANGDGSIDEVDLAILATDWLKSTANSTSLPADFNCDGFINLSDLSIISKNWSVPL